jgi:hypothetical protein
MDITHRLKFRPFIPCGIIARSIRIRTLGSFESAAAESFQPSGISMIGWI